MTLRGAKGKSHSGRTLYDHLKGTHDLLRDWGNSEVVYLGGLFHSIYGTRQFQHASLPLAERHALQKLIGPEAEYLAYVFCVTDRPKVFLDSASIITRHFYDYHRKRMFEVSHLVRSQLTLTGAHFVNPAGNP